MSDDKQAWAYDIVRRWNSRNRKGLTRAAVQIAEDAIRVHQEQAAKRLKEEQEAARAGLVTAGGLVP
jgi:hypothetical protein